VKPEPKSVKIVCTVCGLDWDRHRCASDSDVSIEECVRLLKADLSAKRPAFTTIGTSGGWPWPPQNFSASI
jgi:hypothetical protein